MSDVSLASEQSPSAGRRSEGSENEAADIGREDSVQAQSVGVSTLRGWGGGPQGTSPLAVAEGALPSEQFMGLGGYVETEVEDYEN